MQKAGEKRVEPEIPLPHDHCGKKNRLEALLRAIHYRGICDPFDNASKITWGSKFTCFQPDSPRESFFSLLLFTDRRRCSNISGIRYGSWLYSNAAYGFPGKEMFSPFTGHILPLNSAAEAALKIAS